MADSTLNPAAEAFRNFDTDTGISALSLDNAEESRRAAASRANSVRFDESANNHYGSSRQSIDLPTRTGSGLGSHPLSERSLSHRSDGRGSNAGFGRTNSFGLEQSRLLGSINNSPKVAANPPPGFFILGPCPSIIRCWLTETFSNDSLLYAAVCTGASSSSVGMPLLQSLGLTDQVVDEAGYRKIKLPVYLTEARIHQQASRNSTPPSGPQVPTLFVKFVVVEEVADDKTIQVIIGSDILRGQSADILFSQDKMLIFDDNRNQLTVPLVRPEDDAVYKNLSTGSRRLMTSTSTVRPAGNDSSRTGIIGQPAKTDVFADVESPMSRSPVASIPADHFDTSKGLNIEAEPRTSIEHAPADSKSATGSDHSTSTPVSKSNSGVWGASWRSASSSNTADKSSSAYNRPAPARTMKVLRPSKPSNTSRSASSSNPFMNPPDPPRMEEAERTGSFGGSKADASAPTRSNPVGSGSAFGWLSNPGAPRRTTTNGS
jgi:hypothetical protein